MAINTTTAPASTGLALPSKKATVETVRDYLLANRKQIELALPRFMNAERFMRTAFTAFSTTPALYDCSTRSLLGALIQCAQLGLEPGVLGHVYLVPFKNRKKGTTEVTVIVGYKGLLELARRSGQISTIAAEPVYAGDQYERTLGTDPKIVHVPSGEPVAKRLPDGRWELRAIIAVYAVARLKDGGLQHDAMNLPDIEYHRDRYSRAAGEGPWVTDFESMAKKTVLRKLAKLLPASIELHQAVALDEHAEAGVSQDLASLVSGPVEVEPGTPAPAGKLTALTEQLRTPAAPAEGLEEAPERAVVGLDIEAEGDGLEEAPARDTEAPGPVGTPPGETELALKRSVVLAKRNRLKLGDGPWAGMLREHAGVESFGAATFDGLDQLDIALTRMLEGANRGRR